MSKVIQNINNLPNSTQLLILILLIFLLAVLIVFAAYLFKNRSWLLPQKPKIHTEEDAIELEEEVIRKVSMRDNC